MAEAVPLDPTRESRLAALREQIAELLTANSEGEPPLLVGDDPLAQLESGVRLLSARLVELREGARVGNQRLESFSNMLAAIISSNYAYRLEISEKGDVYDGVASGLNMLAEEIAANTVSQAYIDNIFQSMSESIVVAEPTGAIKMANRGSHQLFGFSDGELLGEEIEKLLPVRLDEIRERGHWQLDESTQTTRRGERILVSISAAVMKNKMEELQGIVFVIRDLTESRRSEAERFKLREAMQRQSILLEELSTPIIPISDQIVVVPLIGSVDAERTKRMAETVMHGVVARRTRFVIIDITGVPMMDQAAIRGIIGTISGLALLGTQVVLTGIRPEVATALVMQSDEISSIATASSLQGGIQHALRAMAIRRFADQRAR